MVNWLLEGVNATCAAAFAFRDLGLRCFESFPVPARNFEWRSRLPVWAAFSSEFNQ